MNKGRILITYIAVAKPSAIKTPPKMFKQNKPVFQKRTQKELEKLIVASKKTK